MRLAGAAIGPCLDQMKVVRACVLNHRIEARGAAILAAVVGLLFDQRRRLVLAGREDVDMGQHKDCAPHVGTRGGTGSRHRPEPARIERGGEGCLQFVGKRFHRRAVRVERRLVAPRFDDCKAAGTPALMQRKEFDIAVFLAGGAGELPEEAASLARSGGGDLEIGYAKSRAAWRRLAGCRRTGRGRRGLRPCRRDPGQHGERSTKDEPMSQRHGPPCSGYLKCGITSSHNSCSERIIISAGIAAPKFNSKRMPSMPSSSSNSFSRSVTRSGPPTTTLSRSTCS